MNKLIGLCFCVMCGLLALCYDIFQNTNKSQGTVVLAQKAYHNVKGGNTQRAFLVPKNLTPRQVEILKIAYQIAKEDGYRNPEILQGLILQESKAGGLKSYRVAGHELGAKTQYTKYYGVGQIKLIAAKEVLKKHPEMWKFMQTREDEEIIANLILNDEFNIRIASKYLLFANNGKVDNMAITAYNQGQAGAKNLNPDTWHYTVKVRAFSDSPEVKAVNARSM